MADIAEPLLLDREVTPGSPAKAEAKRRPFRMRIATALMLGFGALILLAVVSVLAVGLWIGSRNTLDLLGDKAELAIDALVQHTRQHLDPAREQAAYLAKLVAQGELDPNDRLRLVDYMIAAMVATPHAFNAMVAGIKWFENYVPRSIVRHLVQEGEDAGVVSEEREVTVLFTNIVGFTSLAEKMTVSETAEFLNQHYTLIAGCVEAGGGTLDK